jgi:hypothetical protein
MRRRRYLLKLLALFAGGVPLVTYATCDRTGPHSGTFNLISSNDHLVQNVLDFVLGDHHDDDGDDDD